MERSTELTYEEAVCLYELGSCIIVVCMVQEGHMPWVSMHEYGTACNSIPPVEKEGAHYYEYRDWFWKGTLGITLLDV